MAATVNNAHRRTVNPTSGESMMKRGPAGAKCMPMTSGPRESMGSMRVDLRNCRSDRRQQSRHSRAERDGGKTKSAV
jgi:hypothetical protein